MRRKNQKIAFLIDNIPVHIVLDKTQEKLNSIDINVYNNVQDGIMEELKKTDILSQSDKLREFFDDNDSVFSNRYKFFFSKYDFNTYEYHLYIKDMILKGGLTDHKIVDTI
ncbi:hypothetical protein RhiirB3_441249 [Rhizophagus irregularis]|nr:hypothetical protein RhiirB3_441249 [Rhizophagus irregularis]